MGFCISCDKCERTYDTKYFTEFCPWCYVAYDALAQCLEEREKELAEAKAKLISMTDSRDIWAKGCDKAEEQLTEARAEIERYKRIKGAEHFAELIRDSDLQSKAIQAQSALISKYASMLERCEDALKDGDQYNRKQVLTEIASFKKGEK